MPNKPRKRTKLGGKQKRTPQQREADLKKVAEWVVQGKSQLWIGQQLGLSHQQISYDVKQIRAEWKEQVNLSYDEHICRILGEIQVIQDTYWREFTGDGLTNIRKKKVDSSTPKGNVSTEEEIHSSNKGNAALLSGVINCIEKKSKILGIDLSAAIESVSRAGYEIVDPESNANTEAQG